VARAARARAARSHPAHGSPRAPQRATHADDYLRVHAVLDKGLRGLEQLGGEQRHRRRPVANFGVLRPRNVHQRRLRR